MTPDYQIITSTLTLRLITLDDAEPLLDCIMQSATLHQWVDWCHPDFSLDDTERFILATRLNWVKGQAYGFGVFCRESDELLGMVAINELYHTFNMASIGYWVSDKHQGQGIGKKAVCALVEFCFDMLKLSRVEIVCDPDNVPSQRLIESCGGQFECQAPNRFIFRGKPKTGLVYAIIPQ
ncbi:N-acetyltransferase [Vibrio aquaticus]|uniref:N-acetyltransferase n=1 Tax=Vibrio aquaticus TaxID=2496559 RepID=A0A3S0V3K3_9VIBR|nr:GNAT family N-acetyltransferase [Vibrio aquaticus]RTZ16534.1 N-acetyltransferase [Vibrio aquaticus]